LGNADQRARELTRYSQNGQPGSYSEVMGWADRAIMRIEQRH
jgi:hypothetical protein